MPQLTSEELAELTANFPDDGKVRLVTSDVPEIYQGETIVIVSEPFATKGLAFLPFAASNTTCDPSIEDKGPWLKFSDDTSVSLHTGQVYENHQAVTVGVVAGVQDDGVMDVEGQDDEEELDA